MKTSYGNFCRSEKFFHKIATSLVTASILSTSVAALEPMAKESGFSGFILLGAGGISYENSEIAGLSIADLEHKRIIDRGSPDKESTLIPMVSATVKYTLEDKKTEFFFGNSLEDFLRLDATIALGVRHKFDDLGIVGVRLLTSATATDVWEDPLLVGVKRKSTERTSRGLGLKWENIMDSNFEIDVRARKFKFDNDYNGYSLVNNALAGTAAGSDGEVYITSFQQRLLEREGSMASIEGLYTWKISESHILVPSIKFTNDDRDGDARDNGRTDLKLTYLFKDTNWLVATNISAGSSSYDEYNPVFRKKQDTDYISGGVNMTYKKPFGWEDWGINASAFASQGDSDIDFYDTKLMVATVGMIYSF